jgi:hypothetical protein
MTAASFYIVTAVAVAVLVVGGAALLFYAKKSGGGKAGEDMYTGAEDVSIDTVAETAARGRDQGFSPRVNARNPNAAQVRAVIQQRKDVESDLELATSKSLDFKGRKGTAL